MLFTSFSDVVQQRIAFVKWFRELLIKQCEHFRLYLNVLDKQKVTIEQGNIDKLTQYVELEERIVADIFSLQKVIDPVEIWYRSPDARDISRLKAILGDLCTKAIIQSGQNRELLSTRMVKISAEIQSLQKHPYRSWYPAYNTDTSAFIDITT
jgi:hypothetical protein